MKKYDLEAMAQYVASGKRVKSWLRLAKQMKEHKVISERLYQQLHESLSDYWNREMDKLEATAYYESSEESGGAGE